MHVFAKDLARRARCAAERLALVALVLCAAATPTARAQGTLGTIQGSVTALNGSVRLPGALVTLRDLSAREMPNQLSDAHGRFRSGDLPEARHRVPASLAGFRATDAAVVIAPGGST